MSSQHQPTAVAVARAHVDAWGDHDYDRARAALAPDVHLVVTSVDTERRGSIRPGSRIVCMVWFSLARPCCRAHRVWTRRSVMRRRRARRAGRTRRRADQRLLYPRRRARPGDPLSHRHQPHLPPARRARRAARGAHLRVRTRAPGLQPVPGLRPRSPPGLRASAAKERRVPSRRPPSTLSDTRSQRFGTKCPGASSSGARASWSSRAPRLGSAITLPTSARRGPAQRLRAGAAALAGPDVAMAAAADGRPARRRGGAAAGVEHAQDPTNVAEPADSPITAFAAWNANAACQHSRDHARRPAARHRRRLDLVRTRPPAGATERGRP